MLISPNTLTKLMKIILCDASESVIKSWKHFLPQSENAKNMMIKIHNGTLEDLISTTREDSAKVSNDNKYAIVSPGNSFGYLGGGFDLALYRYFGGQPFEKWFRGCLGYKYHTVGSTNVVDVSKCNVPATTEKKDGIQYIIHVPTIVAPSGKLFDESNPVRTGYEPTFNAMWNSLCHLPDDANGLIVPGLCTGYCGVPASISAKSMAFALRLYMSDDIISSELTKVLIMYYLGYRFDPFFDDECVKECKKFSIDISKLKSFDVTKDPIDNILPERTSMQTFTDIQD